MAYSAITNAEIDQDSPVTQQLMTKLRDNPIEVFSGAAGYMNAGNWVPVDWTVGDQTGDGTIYDNDVDGNVSEIDYTLENGWEYMFLVNIAHSVSSENLRVEVSTNGGSSFTGLVTGASYSSGVNTESVVFLEMPRLNNFGKRGVIWRDNGGISEGGLGGAAFDAVRFQFSNTPTIDAGTIRAFRRREYITAS